MCCSAYTSKLKFITCSIWRIYKHHLISYKYYIASSNIYFREINPSFQIVVNYILDNSNDFRAPLMVIKPLINKLRNKTLLNILIVNAIVI